MYKDQSYKITSSDEYKEYMKALCRLASEYVPRIRVQFAEKAYDKYQDETTRRIVLAYGKEAENLDKYLLKEFTWASERTGNYEAFEEALKDDVLNHAKHYAATIKLLFEIK